MIATTADLGLDPARLAQWRYLSHVTRCSYAGDIRRCRECERLDSEARVEDGRKWGWPE